MSPPPPLPLGKRLRRLRMGLETVLGLRRQGFFTPYRYAASVAPPGRYGALERLFEAGLPTIRATLAAIEAEAPALEAFREAAPPAPRFGQSWFPRLDGAAAYAIAKGAVGAPRTVIEVGSGHSTRFLARGLAQAGGGARQIAIDPEPRASLSGLGVEWRRELLSERHEALFAALEPGDVAFFDSSHLLAPGTDVDIILNRLVPQLAPGVRMHIHDVTLPDPYPADWAWRGYNEQNALGPLIAGGGWRILFASAYVATRLDLAAQAPRLAALPLPAGARETSLWLERL